MITLAALFTLFLGACVKGILGIGLPLIAIPGLTLVVGLPTALAICSVPVAFANAWQVWQFRHARDSAPVLPRLLLAGSLGMLLGTWLLASVQPQYLEAAVALVLAAYVALRITSPAFGLGADRARRMAPGVGLAAGMLQGATGLSGPIGITYFHAMRLGRPHFILATGSMFLLFSSLQVPLLGVIGAADAATLRIGLMCLPAMAAGLIVGNRLAARLKGRVFDWLVLGVLCWTSLSLLYRALRDGGLL